MMVGNRENNSERFRHRRVFTQSGSKTEGAALRRNVCFCPLSGRHRSACRKSAINGLMHQGASTFRRNQDTRLLTDRRCNLAASLIARRLYRSAPLPRRHDHAVTGAVAVVSNGRSGRIRNARPAPSSKRQIEPANGRVQLPVRSIR
jgi:hypothetical protein